MTLEASFGRRTNGIGLAGLAIAAGGVSGWLVLRVDALYIIAFLTAVASIAYIFSRNTFERLICFLFFSLPFQAAFVLNLGITVRPSHVLTVTALILGVYLHRIRKISGHGALHFLGAFIFVAVCSMISTPMAPSSGSYDASGIRGLAIRPIIQIFQLIGMGVVMYLTVAYCRDWRCFRTAADVIVAGGLVVLAYGMYQFVADRFGIPYVDINNAVNTDYSFGYREQGISFQGVGIPRPRSTFQEPLNFANFLLFAMPLMLAGGVGRRSGWGLGWRISVVVIGGMLFVVAVSSRGAMVGVVVALVALAAFVWRSRDVGLYIGWLSIGVLAVTGVTYVVAPVVIAGMDLPRVVELLTFRLTVDTELGGRVARDWVLLAPLFQEHPLFGVGFGNVPFYIDRLAGFDHGGVVDAGGLYSRLLTEVGLIGTLSYLMFMVAILVGLWMVARRPTVDDDKRRYAVAIFFSIVADGVQRLSFVGIATDAHLWVMFGLGLALIELARPAEGQVSLVQRQTGAASPARVR